MNTQMPINQLGEYDHITNQVIQMLGDMGVTFPTKIDPSEIVQFPLDLTEANIQELGTLHSYWSAVFTRDTAIHGMIVAQKRSLKFQIVKLKAAAVSGDPQVKVKLAQLEQQFARVDSADAIMTGITDGHKKYADACSREITRRGMEMQMDR